MAIDYGAVENKLRASKAELLSAIAEGGSKAKAGYETAKAEMAAQRQAAVATALEGASGPSSQLVRESLARSGKAYEQAQQGLRLSGQMAADRFSGIARSQGGYLENSANLVPKYAEQAFYEAAQAAAARRSGGRGGRGGRGGGSTPEDQYWWTWYEKSPLYKMFGSESKGAGKAKKFLKQVAAEQFGSGENAVLPSSYARRVVGAEYGMPVEAQKGYFPMSKMGQDTVATVNLFRRRGVSEAEISRRIAKKSGTDTLRRQQAVNVARVETGKNPRQLASFKKKKK